MPLFREPQGKTYCLQKVHPHAVFICLHQSTSIATFAPKKSYTTHSLAAYRLSRQILSPLANKRNSHSEYPKRSKRKKNIYTHSSTRAIKWMSLRGIMNLWRINSPARVSLYTTQRIRCRRGAQKHGESDAS